MRIITSGRAERFIRELRSQESGLYLTASDLFINLSPSLSTQVTPVQPQPVSLFARVGLYVVNRGS